MPRVRSDRLDGTTTLRLLHPYSWAWEPLQEDPTFVLRSMFGAKAAYVAGRLTLCFTASEEPWRGVLVCTDRGHHASLTAEFPNLVPHPILAKWLYLSDSAPRFEATTTRLIDLVRRRDPRIGVEPGTRQTRPAGRKR